MPRRREVPKREILPDPVYNSQLVTKFINSLMSDGKKSVAESVFYGALKKVEDRAKDDPLKVFKKAVDNVRIVTIPASIAGIVASMLRKDSWRKRNQMPSSIIPKITPSHPKL